MTQEALQELLDKQALAELVAAYCRAVDRKDINLLRRLYHKDSTDDHGELFKGSGQAFVDYLERSLPQVSTQHFVGNMLFVIDGARAEGEIYAIRHHVHQSPAGRQDIVIGGRYLDTYIKEEGRWQFLHRRSTKDWVHAQPSSNPHEAFAPMTTAKPLDDSYRLLPALARRF